MYQRVCRNESENEKNGGAEGKRKSTKKGFMELMSRLVLANSTETLMLERFSSG